MKALALLSLFAVACASTTAVPGSEKVRIINPYNEAPYKTRCKDLDEVTSTAHGLGRFEGAIIGARNQVQKLGGNILIANSTALKVAPETVTISGRALACPDDLVPKETDRYQKMIEDQHKKWEQLNHGVSPTDEPAMGK